MKCSKCGKQLPDTTKFCSGCGTPASTDGQKQRFTQNQSVWILNINGQNHGPLTEQQVIMQIKQGCATPETFIWKEGMKEWALLKSIPEFKEGFKLDTSTPGKNSPKQTSPVRNPLAQNETKKKMSKEEKKRIKEERKRKIETNKMQLAEFRNKNANTSQSTFHGTKQFSTERTRGGCLTTWLILGILGYYQGLSALVNIPATKQFMPDTPTGLLVFGATLSIIGASCSVGMLLWKKWAYWGKITVSVISILFGAVFTSSFYSSFNMPNIPNMPNIQNMPNMQQELHSFSVIPILFQIVFGCIILSIFLYLCRDVKNYLD